MMRDPRLLLWAPVAVLTLAVGAYGFRSGWIASNLTETDVINRFAAEYTAATGRPNTDCLAVPSEAENIWLVVICGQSSIAYEYHVNRWGGLEHTGAPRKDET